MKKKIIIILLLLIPFIIFSESDKKGVIIKKDKDKKDKIEKTRNINEIKEYSNTKRWAIVVGINDYEDSYIFDLKKAQNDAKVMSDILKHEGQFDYVFTYTDDTDKKSEFYPSMNNIVSKLEQLQEEIKPDDTFIFFFSGHGIADKEGRSYLLTADTVISHSFKTSLPLYELENYIKKMKVKKNIVFLDACRNVIEKSKGYNTKSLVDEKNSQAELSAVMYATSPGEFSYEHDKEPYGVFTTFIINALKGEADYDNDVMITFTELRKFVEEGVKDWSLQKNKKQKPYTSIKGEFYGDLILSIIPLKERAKYNPFSIKNSYKKQLYLYTGLFSSSLTLMSMGLAGSAAALAVGLVGYSQYYKLNAGSKLEDFTLYWNMKNYGIWSAIGCGILTLVAIIPFAISFTIKPKADKNMQEYSFNIGCDNDKVFLSMGIALE